MILSETTIALLKQLGGTNNSIALKEGTRQFAATDDQKMLGIMDLDEPLPVDFSVFSITTRKENLVPVFITACLHFPQLLVFPETSTPVSTLLIFPQSH